MHPFSAFVGAGDREGCGANAPRTLDLGAVLHASLRAATEALAARAVAWEAKRDVATRPGGVVNVWRCGMVDGFGYVFRSTNRRVTPCN